MALHPTVSAIIPVYNCESFIAAAVDSVLAQSFGDFELIIVDDGATDRSIEICRSYSDPRIRIVSQPNRGLAGARNAGIRHARGRYIAFLDADDLWMPHKLQRHVAHLESSPGLGVSYSFSEFIDGTGRRLGIYQTVGKSPTPLSLCVIRNPIGNGSNAVIRAEVFDPAHPNCAGRKVEHFFFDEELRQAEDFELWVRIATQSRWQFDCIPMPLTHYRINAGGLSTNIRSQRGYHYLALAKIFDYAPEVIQRYRAANIAYLYWYLARILLSDRKPFEAFEHCKAALRFDLSSFNSVALLLMVGSVLQRFLPERIYTASAAVALTVLGKAQEVSMRWKQLVSA